jgi:hypothetical protein
VWIPLDPEMHASRECELSDRHRRQPDGPRSRLWRGSRLGASGTETTLCAVRPTLQLFEPRDANSDTE